MNDNNQDDDRFLTNCGFWFKSFLATLLFVVILWGVYVINTPLDYCKYPLCIKIGDK